MLIDVAPGVDWTAMIAIVMAVQQVQLGGNSAAVHCAITSSMAGRESARHSREALVCSTCGRCWGSVLYAAPC
jgi:hypothetical protein